MLNILAQRYKLRFQIELLIKYYSKSFVIVNLQLVTSGNDVVHCGPSVGVCQSNIMFAYGYWIRKISETVMSAVSLICPTIYNGRSSSVEMEGSSTAPFNIRACFTSPRPVAKTSELCFGAKVGSYQCIYHLKRSTLSRIPGETLYLKVFKSVIL